MKAAAQITQKGMKKAIDVINPGVRQCDAVGQKFNQALLNGTPEFGGEYSSVLQHDTNRKRHFSITFNMRQKISLLKVRLQLLNFQEVYQRYHCPMARTVLLGKPDQKKIDTMKKTNEALQAGIDVVKSGNTADDVAQAFWKILDKYGIEKTSRTGYSIGIGYPPDWGEHTLNISKGDMTVLKPNVTFHMIAVMQFGNWGVEASEAIRVTDKGSELFCNFSKELHVKS